jgi:hypothetical protein
MAKRRNRKNWIGATGGNEWVMPVLLGLGAYFIFSSFTKNAAGGSTTTTTDPNTGTGTGGGTTNILTPGGGGGTSGSITDSTPLKYANSDKIQRAQVLVNLLYNYLRAKGGTLDSMWKGTTEIQIPQNIAQDGVAGPQTTAALKRMYAWVWNINHTTGKLLASEVTYDVMSYSLNDVYAGSQFLIQANANV